MLVPLEQNRNPISIWPNQIRPNQIMPNQMETDSAKDKSNKISSFKTTILHHWTLRFWLLNRIKSLWFLPIAISRCKHSCWCMTCAVLQVKMTEIFHNTVEEFPNQLKNMYLCRWKKVLHYFGIKIIYLTATAEIKERKYRRTVTLCLLLDTHFSIKFAISQIREEYLHYRLIILGVKTFWTLCH